jgi:hypothetical protein
VYLFFRGIITIQRRKIYIKIVINGGKNIDVQIPLSPMPRVEKAPQRGLFSKALAVPIAWAEIPSIRPCQRSSVIFV